jgi:hypothetical protein
VNLATVGRIEVRWIACESGKLFTPVLAVGRTSKWKSLQNMWIEAKAIMEAIGSEALRTTAEIQIRAEKRRPRDLGTQ